MKNNLSIEIYNPEDVTEVAIKTKTEIGQIFQKGYNELYRTIGIENLNMKDKEGNLITDLQRISKGKRKGKSQEIINQYCDIQKRPDLERYAIQITDIFEIPILKEIINKGRKGFYKDKIIPLMVKYLLLQESIDTTLDKLSKAINLVDEKFKNKEIEYDIIKNNSQITISRINKLYSFCKPEQERIIFSVLDSLQNNYSVITYERNFLIVDIDDNTKISSRDETITIRKAQRIVLEELKVINIFAIYQKGKGVVKKFYKKVIQILNNEFGFNCKEYYNQISIYADMEGLKKLDSKFNINDEQSVILKNEIRQHFLLKIKERIKSDYEYNQQSADKKDAENQKKWEENTEYKNNIPHDMQELLNIGVYSETDVKLKLLPKPKKAYRYPENHVEVLYYLCDYLLDNIVIN